MSLWRYVPRHAAVWRAPLFCDVVLSLLVAQGIIASVQGVDGDVGTVFSYRIVAGNDENGFRMTGRNVFLNNATAINYEKRRMFNLGIEVSDGVFTSLGIVRIQLRNKNDPIRIFAHNFSIFENRTLFDQVGPAMEYLDEDPDQSPVFTIVSGNFNDTFVINECSGQMRMMKPINFELRQEYIMTVVLRDTGVPQSSDTAVVLVSILDSNDKPVFTRCTFSIPENSLGGSVIGILPAFDEDKETLDFVISEGNSRGFLEIFINGTYNASYGLFSGHNRYAVRLSNRVVLAGDGSGEGQPASQLVLDYEDPSRTIRQFNLNVFAFDGHENPDNELTLTSAVVTVDVLDVNDRPSMDPVTLRLDENSPNGTLIGAPLEATDQDNVQIPGVPTRSDPLSFRFAAGSSPVPFILTPNGQLIVNVSRPATWLDFETRSVYALQVEVCDSGGVMRGSPKCRTVPVNVSLNNVNEVPSVVARVRFNVSENVPVRTLIGSITATDEDINYASYNLTNPNQDPLTFRVVSGNEAGILLAASPGVLGPFSTLQFSTAVETLDYETNSSFVLNVSVTDPGGASSYTLVVINVTDVNDPPQFVSCPTGASMAIVFEQFVGYSMIRNLVNSPDGADGVRAFDLTGGTNFGAAWQLCRDACARAEACAAYTIFTNESDSEWFGRCYGRVASVSVKSLVGSPLVISGEKQRGCQRVSVPELTPTGTDLGVPLVVSDVEFNGFNVTLLDDGVNTGMFTLRFLSGNRTVVVLSRALDFETRALWLLRLQVVDDGVPPASSNITFAVEVGDDDERPTIAQQNRTVVLNDLPGTRIGPPIVARDDDQARGEVLTFSIVAVVPSTTPYFLIHNATGQLSLQLEMLDRGLVFNVTVRVTDPKGLFAQASVFIDIADSNSRPLFNNSNVVRTVRESQIGPASVPIFWSDKNAGDTHVLNITRVEPSYGASLFAIVATGPYSANVTVTTTAINWECSRLLPLRGCPDLYRAYTLSLQLTDSGVGNLATFTEIVITVVDVPEPPQVPARVDLVVDEMANVSTPLLLTACLPDFYDDDKTPLSFSIPGAGIPFAVTAGGPTQLRAGSTFCSVTVETLNTMANKYPPMQFPRTCPHVFACGVILLRRRVRVCADLDVATDSRAVVVVSWFAQCSWCPATS